MNKAKIIGAYSSSADGEEYITKNGNPFWKICVEVDNGLKIYDAFFCTPKAHWKFEKIFEVCGRVAPDAKSIEFSDIESLVGNNVMVRTGKDRGGYDAINMYQKIPPQSPKMDAPLPVDLEDEEDDDDVPF